jgi:hypothetical protein
MYIAMLLALMLIFPVASIIIETFMHNHGVFDAAAVGRWFVFWAVGVRLLIAGLRQIAQPRFTAETILGVKDPDAVVIVRELGFANTAIGSAGAASIFLPGWLAPLAVIGAVFYGLAGINHVMHNARSKIENAAMTSDFFAAAILLIICWSNRSIWFL